MEKNKVVKIILSVATAGLVVCLCIIGVYYGLQKRQNDKYKELADSVNQQINQEVTKEADEEGSVSEVIEQETLMGKNEVSTTELVKSIIDFNQLQTQVNEHIYAWIKIDGTVIDYPVLQHPTDNAYYLNHNLDHSYGYPGCIYSENFNTNTFDDSFTVLYGHNMKNGTMFGALHQFEDKEFFDKHDNVTIYMPDKIRQYQIIAAFKTDDKRLTVWYDFEDKDVFEQYMKDVMSKSEGKIDHFRKDVKVTRDDRIVALETCIRGDKDHRYLVLALEK